MICSDICDGGSHNVLQEIYSSGDPNFSEIVFQQQAVEAYTKRLIKTGSVRIWVTAEDRQPLNLNGQNVMITLLIYKRSNIFELIKGFLRYQLQLE
jgi:hypothetical protein